MKNLVLGAMIAGATFSYAQNVKPSASYKSNASTTVMEYRKNNFDNAKIFIDAAYEQMNASIKEGSTVKDKVKSKIYLNRGLTYFALADKKEDGNEESYLTTAVESFDLLMGMVSSGMEYDQAKNTLLRISNRYYNNCSAKYNEKDYESALAMAEKSIEIRNKVGDEFLDAYYNAALSASMASKHEKAAEYFGVLIEKGYGTEESRPFLYAKQAFSLKELGLVEEAFKVIKKGRKEFPADRDLFTAEVDHYLQTGQNEKALENIDKLIEAEPNNALYHALKGDLYGMLAENAKKAEDEKAMILKGITSYQKATEIDQEYLHAYFNAGASYISLANETNKIRRDLGMNEAEKANKLKEEEDGYYEKAIKMFESCTVISPEDPAAFDALNKIYFNLGDLEKSSEMKKKVQELQAK